MASFSFSPSSLIACLFVLILIFVSANGEVLYTRKAAPSGWILGGRSPSSTSMTFLIALKQHNLDALEERFWAVSNPLSPLYREFMTKEEIIEMIKPTDYAIHHVMRWIKKHGVTKVRSYGDAIEATATVQQCEALFNTRIHQYKHKQTGQIIHRQFGSFALPSRITKYIDAVFGISTFPKPQHKSRKEKLDGDDFGVIPQTVYNQYNLPAQTVGKSLTITSQAVIEFEMEYFSPSDLAMYGQLTNISIQAVPANQTIGHNDPSMAEGEASTDIETLASVNTEASPWFWLEDPGNWLYGFAVHFFNTPTIPQVVSLSYGYYEGHICDGSDPNECAEIGVDDHEYVRRMNVEFQKIGLRGVSIIAASGDSGAHTMTDVTCTAKTLRAEFPASSPYVTSVGATQLQNERPLHDQPTICTQAGMSCASSGDEVAVSFDIAGVTSGGGFSEVSFQPEYQKAAVSEYLKSGVKLPPSTYYNASMRAHPDVSAVGNNNIYYQSDYLPNSVFALSAGTATASPIFAGIASFLNEVSMKKTNKPLGFLNPLLYKMAATVSDTFHDITSGDNICTEAGCFPTCVGYYATRGWDPVTGLGTPNVGRMMQYIENL